MNRKMVSLTTPVSDREPVVELIGVDKNYGSVKVLDDFNLCLYPGEVVGLIGDNGAGKSTVVKIISGYEQSSRGQVLILGRSVKLRSPRKARELGIETVYQDLAIVDDLTIWRNFFLGRELRWGISRLKLLRRKEMKRICQDELVEIGLVSLKSVDQVASTLSGGERQSLAITRATYFELKLLILDEPVAALSVRETRRVLEMIEAAKSRGLAVLYIDHNMSHVQPVADRVILMEHGKVHRTISRGEFSVSQLSDLLAESGTSRMEWEHGATRETSEPNN